VRTSVLIFVLMTAFSISAQASRGAKAERAFAAGLKAGRSIGEAHPGSPAAKKTYDPPPKGMGRSVWKRGWRQGAYERYVKWLKKTGRKPHEIPTMGEVFRDGERKRERASSAPAYRPEPAQASRTSSGGLGIPSSGSYRVVLPPGSLAMRASFVYDRLESGMYRVRAMSGGGQGPNPFDKGTVMTEAEIYKRLVEDGQITR
jgi:hypothetical protein